MSNAVASPVATGVWAETTLGEVAEYVTSGSRDWSRYYADSGAIFIRTQDINQNRLSLKGVAFVKLPQKVEGKRSLVRKGDLLITITGANVGKVAVVENEILEAYVSQSVCLVRLKDPSIAKFIHLQLMAKRGDRTAVEAMAYGLGRPVLNLENIRSAPIRLAPPKVQSVIVAEIEKQFSRLDEAVASLTRTKANLKRYKVVVLKSAVEGTLNTDSAKIAPGDWRRLTLPQLCSNSPNSIRRGPFGSAIKKQYFVPKGYKVYEQQNAIYDDCSLGRYFINEEKFRELSSFAVRPGDLIISCSGTMEKLWSSRRGQSQE